MFHVVKQTIKLIVIPIIKLKEISLVEINLMYSIIWWASIFVFGRFNAVQGSCHGSILEARLSFQLSPSTLKFVID